MLPTLLHKHSFRPSRLREIRQDTKTLEERFKPNRTESKPKSQTSTTAAATRKSYHYILRPLHSSPQFWIGIRYRRAHMHAFQMYNSELWLPSKPRDDSQI